MTQIFRITHINNLQFILQHGLVCPNAEIKDPNFTAIGFPTLIEFRKDRVVPLPPGGSLSDYVPFYFWHRSPMLYVIWQGNDPEVIVTPQEEIIYLVSSFEALQKYGCRFIYTDRHAKLDYAKFYTDPAKIELLNWELIKSSQWGRQYGSERREIKQAECIVYQHVPINAIIGIAVKNDEIGTMVSNMIAGLNYKPVVKVKP